VAKVDWNQILDSMSKHFKVILETKKNNDYIITIAIGNKFFNDWNKYAKPLWKKYCTNHSLGLIVVTKDLIDKKNKYWKKATWQKMLLGSFFKNTNIKINNICYLDTDILVNPNAPNIFNFHDSNKISLISQVNNLPYNLDLIRRTISFNRKFFYCKKYKLDSSLFMNIEQIYKFHNLKPQKDFACAGVIVFNLKKFSPVMKEWFFKYKKNIKTLSGGGDEPIFNYEMFNTKKVKLLDYKFQALWIYEMAFKYKFLYEYKTKKNAIIKKCIESSLENSYFLHFAGSWYEGQMWKIKNIFSDKKKLTLNNCFIEYLSKKVRGTASGRVLPK
jgi:hypothetical protein